VLVLRLVKDAKSADVGTDVKGAFAGGCIRTNILALFNQTPAPRETRCCSVCSPEAPAVRIIEDKPQVVRVAGELKRLSADLEQLVRKAATTSISSTSVTSKLACLFRPPPALLSSAEIDVICRNWREIETVNDLKRLVQRASIPEGIIEAVVEYRKRMETKKAPKRRASTAAGSQQKRAKTQIPAGLTGKFNVVQGKGGS